VGGGSVASWAPVWQSTDGFIDAIARSCQAHRLASLPEVSRGRGPAPCAARTWPAWADSLEPQPRTAAGEPQFSAVEGAAIC
jgi:hypothetical protein